MTISFKLLAEALDEETPVAIMATIELLRGCITILELVVAGITSIMLLKKSKLSFLLYLAVLGVSFADEKIGTILLRLLTFVGSLSLVVCDQKKLLLVSSIVMIPGLYMQLVENNPPAIELLNCGHIKLEYHHFIGTIDSLLLMTTLLCVVMHHFYITGRKNNHMTGIEQTSVKYVVNSTENNKETVQREQSNVDVVSLQNQHSGGNTDHSGNHPAPESETENQGFVPYNNVEVSVCNNINVAPGPPPMSQSGVEAPTTAVGTLSRQSIDNFRYASEQGDMRMERSFGNRNGGTSQRITIPVNPRIITKRKREEDANVVIDHTPSKKQKTEKEVPLNLKRLEKDTKVVIDLTPMKKRRTENKYSLVLKRPGTDADNLQNSKKKRKTNYLSCTEIDSFRKRDRPGDDNEHCLY